MIDFAGAEKKIRQARYFLDQLEWASSRPLRGAKDGDTEVLAFNLSACLMAAFSRKLLDARLKDDLRRGPRPAPVPR
jgi:hypothetical protein